MDMEPSIIFCAYWMPSEMVARRLISTATSSVGLITPPLISRKWGVPSANTLRTICSMLLMRPTVVMANVPRWERTTRGWGSVSEMQPMPLVPLISSTSCSNFVRKGEFSML